MPVARPVARSVARFLGKLGGAPAFLKTTGALGYEKQVGLDLVSSTQLGPAFILGGLGLCRIYQQL